MTQESADLETYLLGNVEEPPRWLSDEARADAEAARAFACGEGAPPRELQLDVALGLCCALAAKGDIERLNRLAAESGKRLAKEARRALHLLRVRGVAVGPMPRPEVRQRRVVVGKVEEPEPVSLLTPIDALGERGVWFCRYAPGGGVLVFEATVSETKGLTHFAAGRATRKGHRAVMQKIRDRARGVPVPGAYARWLIEEAYRLSEKSGLPVPESFALARSDMGPVTERYDEHPALAKWPAGKSPSTEELLRALDIAEVRGWIPEEDALRATALRIGEIVESRLVASPEQRLEAMHDALKKAAEGYFVPERRALYRRRLLDTAWLVWLAGGREQDAELLRHAAEGFSSTAAPPPNAFELGLFTRVFGRLPIGEPQEEGEHDPGRLIVSPYDRAGAPDARPRPARPR